MKKICKIEGLEKREGKTGLFTLYKTSEGNMSCFKAPEIAKLDACVGRFAELELQVKGNYTNILALIKVIDEEDAKKMEKTLQELGSDPTIKEEVVKDSYNGQTAMYVSYAKDIFNETLKFNLDSKGKLKRSMGEIMSDAITMVKHAKEGFK